MHNPAVGTFWPSCLFFAGNLSFERLDGSQPNIHVTWRGGPAQTLLKMGVIGVTVWQPSWKNSFHKIVTVHVVLTLAQALTKCHPLHSVHTFQLSYNNLMPAPGGLILASSSFHFTWIQLLVLIL